MEGNLIENNTIVVARFKEDLEWLNKLIESELWIERVVIFNKGPENISFSKKALKKIEIIRKENIGREGGTYLICKNNYGRRNTCFQLKIDENLIFRKLNNQEKVLLSVMNYLKKN